MSEISKKWLIENKYFDKEGIEENLIYSGLTANEFIELLDSYHNSMSDVSDEEIEKWFQNYLREGITGANQRIAINEFVKWLRSRIPNKVDVELFSDFEKWAEYNVRGDAAKSIQYWIAEWRFQKSQKTQ